MSSLKLAIVPFLILCLVLAGCGGMRRDLVLMPIAPEALNGGDTLGKADDGYWVVELDTLVFGISPVTLSSKLVAVFGPGIAFPALGEDYVTREGPLLIGLWAGSRRKSAVTVSFDPGQFLVVLEDGRSLCPVATRPYANSEKNRAIESVTFSSVTGKCSGGCGLRKLSSERYEMWLWLEYDVSLAVLPPFTLRPAALIVNGEAIQLPPIPFVHGDSFHGS